jgi:hypothetical protein
MAHLYKVSEWEGACGRWRCNDVQDLAGISGKWWVPARMLGMSLTDYILLLKDEFHADIESYYEPNDVLLFSWKDYASCHKYVLWINSMARKANFIV